MTPTLLRRHLDGLSRHPMDPDYTEPCAHTRREAAEIVAWRLIANGRETCTIFGDNWALFEATRALVLEQSRDITTIANHVERIRAAALETAVEVAIDRHWSMVDAEYARILRDQEADHA